VSPPAEGRIAIVGAGSIGVAWAVVFAQAEMNVVLHDPDVARLEAAGPEIQVRLRNLQEGGLLKSDVTAVAARIITEVRLDEAVRNVTHVQECAPEDLGLKRTLFARLDSLTPPTVTLASSSSAIVCSAFASDLAGRSRCLVIHPGNPPYLLSVAEVVPAPFTSAETVDRANALLRAAGVYPAQVAVEVEGFVFNRLQGALLREAYCLVRDGVVSAQDLDRIVKDGVGLRWSVIGPFATAELNTRGGLEAHAVRMGPAYARMGAERGQNDPWPTDLVQRVAKEIQENLPPEHWEANVQRRDQAIMRVKMARSSAGLAG